MAERSNKFSVDIHGDYTPESKDSPAKLFSKEYLHKGIEYAKVSRLRNVLRKLSDVPGMEPIIKHYLMIGGICEDKEENHEIYEIYEENLRFNSVMPEEDAASVTLAIDESHERTANKQTSQGRREAPIVIDDNESGGGLKLPPIRSITEGAALPAPRDVYGRRALQVLPQQEQGASKKRKPSRHVVCMQCEEVFDAEAEGQEESCVYHDGESQRTTLGVNGVSERSVPLCFSFFPFPCKDRETLGTS
jgi:hypothetical protein